ncbi:MAG: endonuclease/exonuclease/phosphatase family protein [Candidatus Melainabacteria bacterium]
MRQLTANLKLLLRMALWVTVIFTLMAALQEFGFLFDLLAHFRLQYLVLQGVGLALLALWRPWETQQKVLMGALLVALTVNLAAAWPYLAPLLSPGPAHHSVRAAGTSQTLTLLHMNVFHRNYRYAKVGNYIRAMNPDVLLLSEYDSKWRRGLRPETLKKSYPYSIIGANPSLCVFSKYPLLNIQYLWQKPFEHHLLRLQIALPEKTVNLVYMHSPDPFSPWWFKLQGLIFDRAASLHREMGDPFILAGDWNSTPWSVHEEALRARSGLQDTLLQTGLQPSWPTFFPPLMMPLDQVWLSHDIRLLERHTGRYIGSDHLPVWVRVAL